MWRSDVARTEESDGSETGSRAPNWQSEGKTPDPSPVSIIIPVLSLAIMPVLAAVKKKAGTALGDDLILAGAAETGICALLSVSTLTGLILFPLTGAAWVDPVAGLILFAFALPEGKESGASLSRATTRTRTRTDRHPVPPRWSRSPRNAEGPCVWQGPQLSPAGLRIQDTTPTALHVVD